MEKREGNREERGEKGREAGTHGLKAVGGSSMTATPRVSACP